MAGCSRILSAFAGGQTRGPRVVSRLSSTALPLTRVAGSELSPPRLPRGRDEEGQPHEHPHTDQYRSRLLGKSSRAYFSYVSQTQLLVRICPTSFEQGSLGKRSWRLHSSCRFQCVAHECREVVERSVWR